MHIFTLVLMAVNVLGLGVTAPAFFNPDPVLIESAAPFLAIAALVGLVGVARRSAWGQWLSALALGGQVVVLTLTLRREWGHLHGGELYLEAWIALAAVTLLSVFVRPNARL